MSQPLEAGEIQEPKAPGLHRNNALSEPEWQELLTKLRAEGFYPLSGWVVPNGKPTAVRFPTPGEAENPSTGLPATPPASSSSAAAINSVDADADEDDPLDPRLGIPSIDLRDEQMWLDHKGPALKLPSHMVIEAKNAIWEKRRIIGVIWRGTCSTAHSGKRRWILTHYRKDYPDSCLLYIKGQRRRVIQERIW